MNRVPDVPAVDPLLVVWTRIPKTGSTTLGELLTAAAHQKHFDVFSYGPAVPGPISPEAERELAETALNQTIRGQNGQRRPRRGIFFGVHRWHIDFAKYATAEEMKRVAAEKAKREEEEKARRAESKAKLAARAAAFAGQ